ncbi:MAG: hypothetical protein FWE06_02855 [Oscillospiraceae bacterium]|nr:hypothetical protein [Oscillospiraceae bacterium]
MSVIIANFEDADTAEWALRNLRDTGVAVNAMQVLPRQPQRPTGLFPYIFNDIYSTEVTMKIDVAPQDARRAKAYLVSKHASQITSL